MVVVADDAAEVYVGVREEGGGMGEGVGNHDGSSMI
jgi:hypothetical protein